MMQQKTTALSAMIIAFSALLIISNVQEVYSHDVNVSQTCSNETLNGSYGVYRAGTTADGPIAAVGLAKFDAGNMTFRNHTSRNGHFSISKGTGRIEVAADCTIKVFADSGEQLSSGIVVEDGDGFFLLNRNPGSTVILVARRIHAK